MRTLAATAALAVLLTGSVAQARCRPVSPQRDLRESAHVAEATLTGLENGQMSFRVHAFYKGDPPRTLTLSARRGRGTWAQPSDVGTRYLLFLRANDEGGFYVMRCGGTARLADARRSVEALEAAGLRRQPR